MLLSMLLTLSACGEEKPDAPEGMQLVRGSDSIGYYFYAPDNWVVANDGNKAASYVSTIDSSAVSLVEVKMPEEPVVDYISGELARFPEGFELETTDITEDDFGNADSAYKVSFSYTYSYEYGEKKMSYEYMTMQYYAIFHGRFFIFTYTGSTETRSGSDKSYYEYHLENVAKIVENTKFVDKSGEDSWVSPSYEYGEDGYALVSDRELCYFDLYLPREYTVDYSTSVVSAHSTNGEYITASEITYTTRGDVGDYWKYRFTRLDALADNVTYDLANIKDVELGGNTAAVGIDFSYTLDGADYKAYQVIVNNGFHIFMFTYVAEAASYDAGLEVALDILHRMRF